MVTPMATSNYDADFKKKYILYILFKFRTVLG